MKQQRLLYNIVGGSYESDERFAGCAVSQNLYVESIEEGNNGTAYPTSLRSVDGERIVLDNFVHTDKYKQGCRGLFTASDNSIYAAFGDGIYRIEKDEISKAYRSALVYNEQFPTIGPVSFCETGGINSHVCWVDGSTTVKAWPINPLKAEAMGFHPPFVFTTPLRQYKTADEVINDSNEHIAPMHICSINGSLVIDDPKSDTWYYTDAYILGGTTYKREIYELDEYGNVQYVPGSNYKVKTRTVGLTDFDPSSNTSYLWLDRYSKPNFTTAEYSADNVTGMCVAGDRLFVFGNRSIQSYSQSLSTDAQGFSSMVFSSTNGNVRDIGCDSPETIKVVGNNVVFLCSSSNGEKSIVVSSGQFPTRISTNAIDREIEGADAEKAFSFTYSGKGHQFYGITFPSIHKTFVYDFATSLWHNRATFDPSGSVGEWWGRYVISSKGDVVFSGAGIEKLVVFDRLKYDDYLGNPIIKTRTTPAIINDNSPFMVNDVLLVWNNGTTGDVTNEKGAQDPVVMLEISEDGGNTYGDEEWSFGGRTGQYAHRTMWYGVGAYGTEIVFRFTISDRVNVVITGGKIGYTVLSGF